MKTHLILGAAPYDEPCAQLGADNYDKQNQLETARYIELLKKKFPGMPAGCFFQRKGFSHDFGFYHEVVICFDEEKEEQADFAGKVEDNLPATWDDDGVVK